MAGFPYYTEKNDQNDERFLSDAICEHGYTIVLVSFLVLASGVNPASASDVVSTVVNTTGNSTKSRTVSAIALLGALDTVACNHGYKCIAKAQNKVAEKAAQSPKVAVVVGCTAAVVWCARGIAERVINKHI